MATTLNHIAERQDGVRERLSRLLAVATTLYGLLAALTGTIAAAGLFGLPGLQASPEAASPARLLGLPWSLAAGAPTTAGDPAVTLLVTLGALVANILILAVATGLVRGRLRGA